MAISEKTGQVARPAGGRLRCLLGGAAGCRLAASSAAVSRIRSARLARSGCSAQRPNAAWKMAVPTGARSKTVGEPDQIAAAHLYLMDNRLVTGTVLTVDGGAVLL
jgi:NAD(P)-dependent dehydrogenase (short-subunit alcohol dehydrogenase family)